MNASSHTPEQLYARIVHDFVSRYPEVASEQVGPAKRFGKSGELKVHDKMFAMLFQGRFAVKLSAQTVNALVEAGEGSQLVMGNRVMKQWFVTDSAAEEAWTHLAEEAKIYVTADSGAR